MVRLGREALIVADPDGSPLSHWSFPTIERVEAGSAGAARATPPGEGVSETLEIADPAMVEAVERVRRALARRAPRRRWRRWVPALLVVVAAVMGAARLPDALRGHAVRVAPPEVRRAIGEALATRLSARFGRPCHGAEGLAALDRLTQRLGQPPRNRRACADRRAARRTRGRRDAPGGGHRAAPRGRSWGPRTPEPSRPDCAR